MSLSVYWRLSFKEACFSESDESTLGNWTALFDYSVHADFLSVAKCFSDEKQISNLVYDKKHNFGYSSLLHLRVHIWGDCCVYSSLQRLDTGLPGNKHTSIYQPGLLLLIHFLPYLEKASHCARRFVENSRQRNADIFYFQTLCNSQCRRL